MFFLVIFGGINMNAEFEVLSKFENDSQWLHDNIDSIRKENENKFVAVKDKHIIGTNKNFENLVKDIENKGINPAFVVIEFITEKGFEILL